MGKDNDEAAGGFTTIDLLRVDLFTGEAGVYKYGAAPTYVKKGYSVSRITGTALPAGLTAGEGVSPDVTRLQLEAGDCVLLVTDGVAGSASDQWVRDRLAAFDGGSPRELAQALIDDSGAQVGAADDRTALGLEIARGNQKVPGAVFCSPAGALCLKTSTFSNKRLSSYFYIIYHK